MQGYASPQPIDKYANQVQPEQASPFTAITQGVSGTLLSSVFTLDDRATVVEVSTGNGPAAIKWWGSVVGSPSITGTNYDNVIPANWTRRFVIPISILGQATAGSIVGGAGAQNGLYKQIAVIPLQATAPTSIWTAQF